MNRWIGRHIEWVLTAVVALAIFAAKAISAEELAPVKQDVAVLKRDVDDHNKHIDDMSTKIDYLYRTWGGPPIQPTSTK